MMLSSQNYIIPITNGYRPRPVSAWHGAYSLSSIETAPAGGGIDILVDWSGNSQDTVGSFSVLAAGGQWEHCSNIEPDEINDLIYYPSVIVSGDALFAYLKRGPLNPDVEFKAKALRITWSNQPSFSPSPEFTLTRGEHYDYAPGMDPDDDSLWVESTLNSKGVQQVTLELVKGKAYEIWVNLKHPSMETWLLQDPVVSGDSGGTGGG